MTFTTELRQNQVIFRIQGDLISEKEGATVIQAAESALQQQVRHCLIDISGLRYINSSGIGILITVLTKFRNRGGDVYLINPSESVQKLLIITKLNSIFNIIRNENEVPQP
ncbi:MAG: STAS domain-containing protein [Cyclobacteriaceae bacterium]|nr:STAS domain-containing protein [Cyclobacteriaceae bacterium]